MPKLPCPNLELLPFVAKADKSDWYSAAKEGISLVLAQGSTSKYEFFCQNAPYDQILLLDVCRVQMVDTLRFVGRFIFYVRLRQCSS